MKDRLAELAEEARRDQATVQEEPPVSLPKAGPIPSVPPWSTWPMVAYKLVDHLPEIVGLIGAVEVCLALVRAGHVEGGVHVAVLLAGGGLAYVKRIRGENDRKE